MKGLQPVIWSKGTFLTPQHLQAQDRFIENTLRFQMEALSFRPWGFESLELDVLIGKEGIGDCFEIVLADIHIDVLAPVVVAAFIGDCGAGRD